MDELIWFPNRDKPDNTVIEQCDVNYLTIGHFVKNRSMIVKGIYEYCFKQFFNLGYFARFAFSHYNMIQKHTLICHKYRIVVLFPYCQIHCPGKHYDTKDEVYRHCGRDPEMDQRR